MYLIESGEMSTVILSDVVSSPLPEASDWLPISGSVFCSVRSQFVVLIDAQESCGERRSRRS